MICVKKRNKFSIQFTVNEFKGKNGFIDGASGYERRT